VHKDAKIGLVSASADEEIGVRLPASNLLQDNVGWKSLGSFSTGAQPNIRTTTTLGKVAALSSMQRPQDLPENNSGPAMPRRLSLPPPTFDTAWPTADKHPQPNNFSARNQGNLATNHLPPFQEARRVDPTVAGGSHRIPPARRPSLPRDGVQAKPGSQNRFPWPANFGYATETARAPPAQVRAATNIGPDIAAPSSWDLPPATSTFPRQGNDSLAGQGRGEAPRSGRGRGRGPIKKVKRVAKQPLKRAYSAETDSQSSGSASQGRKHTKGKGRAKPRSRAVIQEVERDLWGGVQH
jgi:hypothetical protein